MDVADVLRFFAVNWMRPSKTKWAADDDGVGSYLKTGPEPNERAPTAVRNTVRKAKGGARPSGSGFGRALKRTGRITAKVLLQ